MTSKKAKRSSAKKNRISINKVQKNTNSRLSAKFVVSTLRIMVLGIDVEGRNVYIQHWVDLKKNPGKLYKSSDTQIRFMRYFTKEMMLDRESSNLKLKLELFECLRIDHIIQIPECDLIVIVLPFRFHSLGFNQRVEKFCRSLRLMVEGSMQKTYNDKVFWQRTIILLEDKFHKNFQKKSLGTFVRERTQGIVQISDMLTSTIGMFVSVNVGESESVCVGVFFMFEL